MPKPANPEKPTLESRGKLPPERCLLSEFDLPGFRFIARNDHAGWWLALACALWTIIVLWLGDLVGGNSMAIVLHVTAALTGGDPVIGSVPFTYGYLSTANTAPYYLIVGPILLVLTHRFLRAAGESLLHCEQSGVLKNGEETWHERIARINRRWCRLAPALAFPIILAISMHCQLSSLSRSRDDQPAMGLLGKASYWEVGYVQSPNHAFWADNFNHKDATAKTSIIDNQNRMSQLAGALFEELDRRNATGDTLIQEWITYSEGKPAGFELKDAFTSEGNLNESWLRIEATAVHPVIRAFPSFGLGEHADSLKAARDSTDDHERTRFLFWFRLFIILGQVQIAFFFTYMLWLSLKVCVYFCEFYRLLPDTRKRGWEHPRFSPYVYDPVGRYGLGAMFAPYNLLVLIIAIGSSHFALNLPDSNFYRAIAHAEGAGSDATRIWHIFAIIFVTGGVLIGPMWLYPKKLGEWTERRHLTGIRLKIGGATSTKEKNELLEQENTIQKQSTWPRSDIQFRLTLAVVIAVLLLPVSAATDFLPGGVAPFMRLPQYLRNECKEFAVRFYRLEEAPGWEKPKEKSK